MQAMARRCRSCAHPTDVAIREKRPKAQEGRCVVERGVRIGASGNEGDGFMSVKTSVSISAQQESFARSLVEEGRYASLSAVVQRGLELVKQETEQSDSEIAALRSLLKERQAGDFYSVDEAKATRPP